MSTHLLQLIAIGLCIYGFVLIWSRGQHLYAIAGASCWALAALTYGWLQTAMFWLGALIYGVSARKFMSWYKQSRDSKRREES